MTKKFFGLGQIPDKDGNPKFGFKGPRKETKR